VVRSDPRQLHIDITTLLHSMISILSKPSCSRSCRFFLIYRNTDHRALHSFPTRRSSDLDAAGTAAVSNNFGVTIEDYAEVVRDRSEEHTSELQSLAYLVCRLLLEKKKQLSVGLGG